MNRPSEEPAVTPPGRARSLGRHALSGALALAVLLAAAGPAGAQTEVWSATLTPGDIGFDAIGCSSSTAHLIRCATTSFLSDDDFTHGGTSYTVVALFVDVDGNFVLSVDTDYTPETNALTLVVGSTSLVLADARALNARIKQWDSAGVSLTIGTAIEVKLTTTVQPNTNTPATGKPTITGTAQVGQTLTAVTTDIMDANGLTSATYMYQWIRANGTEANIASANSSTYALVAADLGKTLKVKVTFDDDASNTETLTSAATATVTTATPTPATGAPTITGTALVGRTLTAVTTGIADANGLTSATYTYQWIRVDGTEADIASANSSTYTLRAADLGTTIKVRVTFDDDVGTTEMLTSAATATVTAVLPLSTVWSATLTPGDIGFDAIGCSSSTAHLIRCATTSFLSDDDFTHGGTSYTVVALFVDVDGNFVLSVDTDYTPETNALTLVVGSTSLVLADARALNARIKQWDSAGVSLTIGTAIEVKLTTTGLPNTNAVPTVANAIPNQTAMAGTALNYEFPANTFADTDTGDTLTYTATKSDNTALPSWLSFAAATRTFSGTPMAADVGTVSVKVTASDGNGGSVSDTFDIVVSVISSDATLSALELEDASNDSAIAISPVFALGTTFYMAFVDNGVDEITIKPTVNESNATVAYLDGSDTAITDADAMKDDQQVSLDVGMNTIKVKVTAEDDTTNTYTVVVTRAAAMSSGAVLISNIEQLPGNNTSNFTRATSFTTGDNNAGYLLSSVDIYTGVHSSTVTPRVEIYENNSGTNQPGTLLVTLTGPGTIAAGNTDDSHTFNDTSDTILEAETLYWLVVTNDSAESGVGFNVKFALNQTVDPGHPNWYIENSYYKINILTTSWVFSNFRIIFALKGTIISSSNNAPTVATVIPDQTAMAGTAFSYAFPDTTFTDADSDTLTYAATKSDDSALPAWLSFAATTRTFSGTPQAADVGTVSVKVTASDGNGGSVSDTFDIVVSLTADTTAPRVASIVRGTPSSSPTNADSLIWRVTFSEAVSNVDAADFAVTGTTATLSVSAVSGVTGAYDVTASGGNLPGVTATVTLSIATGHDIQDAASTALTNTTPTGANDNTYVVDNTAPTVTITGVPTTSIAAFTATFTFSEAVTGFVVGKITLGNATASSFMVTTTTIYTASITPTANGEVTVDVAADAATDAVGNGNTAATQASSTYTMPVPTITIAAGTTPVAEGVSAAFTLTRSGGPPGNPELTVNVSVTATEDMVAAADKGAKTVTFQANSATAMLGVATVADSVDETDSVVTATVTTNSATYTVGTSSSATVTVTDDDTRGVTVSAPTLAVNEGSSGTYTVKLDSEPTATVTVTPSSGNSDVTVSSALTFTTTNWSTTQTVTVTAAHDSDEVDDSATISHAVSGGDYGAVTAASVTVTVDDDETADTTAPRVASIVRGTPSSSPTNADSLTWRVTFSETVSNVDTADFAVTGTTATLSVSAVSGVTGAYDVTASGGNLPGVTATVTLSIATGHNIQDAASNALTNTTPTGANDDTYVVDNTAPTVTITGVPTTSIAAFTATFTFSEAVTGFVVGKITLGNATASSFMVTSTTVYTALITPTANGAVTVDVAADVATDAADNGNPAATQASSTYTASSANNAAMGAPTITGTTQVGETLTAVTTGITDADGLTSPGYTYKWIRVNGTAADITSANSSTYLLVAADLGKTIKVKVSFTDDASNTETLTSAATATVTAATVTPVSSGLVSNVGQSESDSFGLAANDLAQSFTTGTNATGYTLNSIELRLSAFVSTVTPTVTLYSGSADGTEVATLTGPAMLDAGTIKNYTFTPSSTSTALLASTPYWVVAEGDAYWVSTTSTSEDATPATGWSIANNYESRHASSTGSFTTFTGFAFKIRVNGTTGGTTPTNTAPTAANNTVTTDEDMAYTFEADDFGFADTDAGAALASVKIVTLPTPGTLALDGTDVTLKQVVTKAQIDGNMLTFTPVAGASGDPYTTFTFTVNDGTDDSASAYTMTIDVTAAGGNIPATGAPTITGTAQVGQTLTAVTTGITDADGLTSATYMYQWIRVNSTEADITSANSSTYALVAADLGKTIKVKVSFTDDASNTETLTSAATATVTAATVTPVSSGLVSNVGQSESDSFGLAANDFAQSFTTGINPTGYTLTSIELRLIVSTVTPTVTLHSGSATGTKVATLTGPAMLDAGTIKNYTFTPSSTSTALLASTPYWVVAEGDAYWVSTTSTSEDATPATGWSIANNYESRHASSTGSFTTFTGFAFKIRVNGTTGGTTPTNTAPTAANNTVTTDEDAAYTFTAADFGFMDADAGAALASVKIVTVPAVGELALDGTAVLAAAVVTKAQIDGDMLTFTPARDAHGVAYTTFTFTVNDGTDDSASAYTMTIDVTDAPNNAPTVANAIPNQTAMAGTALNYAFPADTFADTDTGDTLAYTATQSDDSALPSWLSFAAATRTFSGTPMPADVGTVSVKVTASDGNGGSVSDTFDIVVSLPADTTAPRVASIVRGTPSSSPTNADSLIWRVTFSEAVSNVDTADFAVTGTTATLSVSAVSGVTGAYDVTATGGNLPGVTATVTLSIAAGHNIQDAASTALTNTTPTGTNDKSYVVDNTAPTVTITGVPMTSIAAFTATFTFSEAVTGFVVGKITLGNATASSFMVTTTTIYTALITPTANGAVTVDVAADAALDAAGNGNTAATQASSTYTMPVPTITIAAGTTPVAEGVSAAFTLTRSGGPPGNPELTVNVSVTATQDMVAAADKGAKTVTFQANSATAMLGVATVADSVDETDSVVTATVTANPATYTVGTSSSATVTVTDDDTRGVTVSAPTLAVNEGSSGTYTVVLDSEPTASVTVTPSSGNSDVTVSSALTFTTMNWSTAQTVTVTAAHDSDAVDDSATISHAVEGGDYGAVTAASVTVTVDDDETADTTAPTVASIARGTPSSSPTNADSLTWRVTFSEAVSNVDTADFAVSGTTATLSVSAVSGVTGAYDVTASGGNLAGVTAPVTLSIASGHDIQDAASTALTNTTPTGANDNTYVVDNTAPTVTITGVPTTSIAAFTATFTFSEAVTGFVVGKITLGNATASSFMVTTTTVYTALITPTANGAVTVDVAADAATDAAGNGNTAATQASSTYTASSANNAAMGAPTITGTAQVGETLTAVTTGIMDADGLINVTYTYQWIRVNGTAADITSANSSTYLLVAADLGKTIKVKVSFTDDASHAETLTSAASVQVTRRNPPPPPPPTNTPPVVANPPVDQEATTGDLFTYVIPEGAFTDADGDPLTYTAALSDGGALPGWLTFDPATRTFTGTPGPGDSGPVRVTVTASDGTATVSDEFALMVTVRNTPPVVANPPVDQEATTGDLFTYVIPEGAFTDADGDPLTYTAALSDGGALPGWLTFDPATRTFTGTPGPGDSGPVRVTVTASDGTATVSDEFALMVTVRNTPPVVANPLADQEVTVDVPFTYVVPADAFTDADGNPLTYTAALSDGGLLPSWLTFDPATRTFTGTPGPGDSGPVFVTVTASDGTVTVSDEFVLMVTVRNTAPEVAIPLADQEVMIDVPFTYVVPADAFTDADGDPLAYTAATRDGGLLPSWLTFDPATRTFTGTPGPGDGGPVRVTVMVSDGTVTVSDEFALRVLMVAPSTLQAWTSRFGRTVATHVTDAVGERLRPSPEQDSHVTVGGYRLPLGKPATGRAGRKTTAEPETDTKPETATDRLASLLTGIVGQALGLGLAQSEPGDDGTDPRAEQPEPDPRLGQTQTLHLPTVRLRDVLLGSSFRLTLGDDNAAPGHMRLTAWGRVAGTQFNGRDGAVTLDGNVLTGTVGVDSEWDRLLAGLAVSHSLGGGSFSLTGAGGDDNLDNSTLTSIHPYLRYAVNERVDVWGVLGYGWGDMTLEPGTGGTLETDTTLLMGSFGGRGILLSAPDNAGFQLAARTDAMLTRTTSGAVAGLAETEADAHRLRLVLEGSRGFTWPEGRILTPTLELGLRHDWGDAETGFGLELGGRVQYANTNLGLTIEAAVRGLLTHEDSDYKEWGASGTIRLAPDLNGQGLSLTLAPTWGAASSGIESLWSRQTTAGLAPQGNRSTPAGQLNAEVGYGVAAPFGTGLLTPYAGALLSDGPAHSYRLGTRWTSVSGLTLNVEGTRQAQAGQQPPTQGLQFQVTWGF